MYLQGREPEFKSRVFFSAEVRAGRRPEEQEHQSRATKKEWEFFLRFHFIRLAKIPALFSILFYF
jgi:hypothetical protein